VRRLQLRGSARLSRYLSRLSHQGLEAANSVALSTTERAERESERAEVAVLTGSVGSAFSEDSDFDELDDLGRRAGRDRFGRRVRAAPLSTGRQRLVAVLVALFVIVLGTRDLFFGTLPLVGQLAPLPSWSTTLAPLLFGLAVHRGGHDGTRLTCLRRVRYHGHRALRAMGTLQRVLLLGCIPLGALGVARFMRPLVSSRARVVAVIAYLGLPLPYGSLGAGRWDGLVAYALFPFIALWLARAGRMEPYAVPAGTRWRTKAGRAGRDPGRPDRGRCPRSHLRSRRSSWSRHWRGPWAPCWWVGARPAGAPWSWQVEATAVALVLAAPWVVGTALAGNGSVAIFGLPVAGATAPDWGEIVRFAVGPVARSPLVWLLVAAAALPLAIGRGIRLLWAARLWVTACASWGLALAAVRGDMGSFAPSLPVVLAPAALAVAACLGVGISSFENDLTGREFGWRQLTSVVAVAFLGVGLLPVAAGAVGGRWGLPSQGIEQVAFLPRPFRDDRRRSGLVAR